MADRYYDRDDRDRGREPDYGTRPDRDRYRDWTRGDEPRHGRHDRDFFDRAGDEVRSWFGDEEAARRREVDERRQERERGYADRGRDPGWRPRSDDWRERRSDDLRRDAPRSAALYTGSLDARDWSPRDSGRDDGPRNEYFTSDRGHLRTSGRGRDYGDDDRSWPGGGQHWGRELGWGPESRGHGDWTGRFTGRGPRGYQRSDERIREDVCDRLTMHGDIDASNVEVEVVGAEVTMRGMVDSRSSRRLAEDVAEAVPGVRHVHNEVRVGQPDASGTGGASGGLNAGAGGTAAASLDPSRTRERVR